jgi:hypothetical protein
MSNLHDYDMTAEDEERAPASLAEQERASGSADRRSVSADTAEEDRLMELVEALARRIVQAMWGHTDGLPMRWVLLRHRGKAGTAAR